MSGPTDFQGAFCGAVNQYGSGLHDEGEEPLPPKYTSLNNIVPVGVQLDRHCPPANGTAAAAPRAGWQPHAERPKQGSQQRGPGRPAEAHAARDSPAKHRAASEPQPEPSFGRPASAAAGPVAGGGAPAAAAAKKPFKFKVKLGGRVVGSAGGSLPPSPLRDVPLEANAIGEETPGLCASRARQWLL